MLWNVNHFHLICIESVSAHATATATVILRHSIVWVQLLILTLTDPGSQWLDRNNDSMTWETEWLYFLFSWRKMRLLCQGFYCSGLPAKKAFLASTRGFPPHPYTTPVLSYLPTRRKRHSVVHRWVRVAEVWRVGPITSILGSFLLVIFTLAASPLRLIIAYY